MIESLKNIDNTLSYSIGKVESGNFIPEIKTKFHDEWFTIRAKQTDYSGIIVTDKLQSKEYEKNGVISRFYEKQGFEKGAIENEIEFASRPALDYVDYELEHSGIVFLPQGELSKWELEQVEYKDPKTKKTVSIQRGWRPDAMIGGMCVYSKYSGNSRGTGKIADIPCPVLIDANNNSVKCELVILSATEWRVYMPVHFLDTATYPVVLDPVVGYNTLGASQTAIGDSGMGCKYTAPATGTITALYVGCIDLGGSVDNQVCAAKYLDNAGTPSTIEAHGTSSGAVLGSNSFVDVGALSVNGGAGLGITSGVDFWIMIGTSYSTDVRQLYDAGSANQESGGGVDITTGFPPFNWPSSWTNAGFNAVQLSLKGDFDAANVNSIPIRGQTLRPALFKPGNAK